MKILFVEDELSKNIPRIVRIFGKYLGKKRIKELELAENDESGYGADPANIKRIVEETDFIEVEYRFPDALNKIINNYKKYAIFIVDRNLLESDYKFEEVKTIDAEFSDVLFDKFFEREGDYLLQKLIYSGVDVLTKFYFLTAYSADDELRDSAMVRDHIDFGKFTKENFIEKGNERHFERLKNILENIRVFNLRNENKQYLNILRNKIDEQTPERFLQILLEMDNEKRISNNLNEMRKIYVRILKASSAIIPKMGENCLDKYGEPNLGQKTIDWLSTKKLINTIQRNFFFSLKAITSDFGSHENIEKEKIYKPTLDTVKSLAFALKDSILWFNDICRKHK